jgi:hypothetical protein
VNGPDEVKTHPWLANFPWEKLANKEMPSPFTVQVREEVVLNFRSKKETTT